MANETLSLHISGMHCAACVGHVEKALRRVPGLVKAEVQLTEHRAQLELLPGWQTQHLVQALHEAGYEAPLSSATLWVEGLREATELPRLEAALQAVPGVLSVSVNLAQGSVRLQALPSTPAASLLTAAQAAGFRASLQSLSGGEDPLAAEQAGLRRDLLLAWAATLPLLLPMVGMPFGIHWHLPAWAQTLLAGFVLVVPGRRLLGSAWRTLRAGAPGMDLLVSLGALRSEEHT
ncbi:MAG: cation transporter, partial [Burkholderiales bacterium]|nr:cation transporter [Burkholderiales bacterium]